ncbi:hypothetical protein ABW20_dc0101674 [Dactylellina cionopaga]|nr:hypothetical protein ABW20_dc0101674 [Dactylellina cionopaga]
MRNFILSSIILSVFTIEVHAVACPAWAGQICGQYGHKKRAGFDIFERASNWELLNNELVKRDGPVAGSDPTATTYLYATLPQWAALPGSSCGFAYVNNGAATTAICPVGFRCQCQPGGSTCVTTTAPTDCTQFNPGTVYDVCTVRWTTTITDVASAYGQCGGFTDSSVIAGSAWTTATMCPQGYGCACRNFWYSQCLPTVSYATTCPPATGYWGCAATITKNSGAYRQCGGVCWDLLNSPKGCDAGFSCWTKTSQGYEAPGQYAMCQSTRPDPHYQSIPESLCYPVPYTYIPDDSPTCAGNPPVVNTPAYTGPQTLWGQCGGEDWSGPTSCDGGGVCVVQDQYYSQCVAGSRVMRRAATPVENPDAVVTPVKRLTQRDLLGPARPGSRVFR